MNFNDIVKNTLLPTLSSYGFAVLEEAKGYVVFRKKEFEVAVSYDWYLSKDLNWRVCYERDTTNTFCVEDFDISSALNVNSQKYETLPEDEQIYKFANYCEQILIKHGATLFDKKGFLQIWEKSTLKIIL